MALGLSLTASQSNDATYLILTDATGETAATGWGVGGNEDYTDIVISTNTLAGNYHLLLDVVVTDKDGTDTTYTQLNLFNTAYAYALSQGTSFSGFTATTDLTWILNASNLTNVSTSVAMGTSSDKLIDGIYSITYSLVDADDYTTEVDSYTMYYLVDGDVTISVYDALREISQQYDNELNDESREIMEALLKYSYLISMQNADTTAEQSRIINMLWTLDKMNSDSSKYSW